jgi:hypothetical protein
MHMASLSQDCYECLQASCFIVAAQAKSSTAASFSQDCYECLQASCFVFAARTSQDLCDGFFIPGLL